MFAKYPEISNRPAAHTYAVPEHEVWIATHKLDGTNMSVIIARDATEDSTSTSVSFARRNGLLAPTDNFYGWQDVVPKAGNWTALLEAFPGCKQVTVYGELYGGKYPHPDVPADTSVGPVQRSVFYHPQKHFAAFDVRVDGEFVEYTRAAEVLRAVGVPVLPVVFSGPRDEVLAWAHAHRSDDVNPAWYGFPDLPCIAGNAGEGWVVRPEHNAYTTHRDRVIFKVKNPKFGEMPEKPPKKASGSAPAATPAASSAYVTEARVSNVLGKELPERLTFKNFAELVALVQADAAKDAAADGVVEDAAVSKTAATTLVRAYLKDL